MEKLEELETDWKQCFFVLAVLLSRGDLEEANRFVLMVIRRPTWRAVDVATECANCSFPASNHPNKMCDVFCPPRN